MTLDEYQQLAARTMNQNLLPSQAASCYAMGLAGEAGEAVDLLKKIYYHQHPLDIDALKKELGDTLWYIAALCTAHHISLEADVASANIDKLRVRYPDRFTAEASLARVDVE